MEKNIFFLEDITLDEIFIAFQAVYEKHIVKADLASYQGNVIFAFFYFSNTQRN